MTLSVLIVDDERDVATMVGYSARIIWPDCAVTTASGGAEALRRFAAESPDLVVLDVQMPPPDGFTVLEQIRRQSAVPILMLTARGEMLDKVRAFDLGADDYIIKPFDHLELLARLRALVRRSGLTPPTPPDLPPPLVAGDLSLDPATHEVRVGDRVAPLTTTEYRLLKELLRHTGRTLPHAYLLAQVWGAEYAGDLPTLRVLVGRLRRKLGDDADPPRYIHTERNFGYRFSPPR